MPPIRALEQLVVGSPDVETTPSAIDRLPPELQFTPGPPDTWVCIVRREGLVVARGNAVQFRCLPGDSPPAPDPQSPWRLADRKALFLGADNSIYRVNKLTLTPIP